jgi:hypothetical protein
VGEGTTNKRARVDGGDPELARGGGVTRIGKSAPSLDELLIYAVQGVLEAGEECTFERLVYECFTRFPESFGFRRYPQWPDSARVNKGWLRCRTDRGWLIGSVQEGFRLTSTGEQVAKAVSRQLEHGVALKPSPVGGTRTRERYESLIRNIRRDSVFLRFSAGRHDFEVTEMEFRRLLGATMETPRRILRQSLDAFKTAARTYGDDELLNFLETCGEIMAPLISPGRKPNERSNRRGNPAPAN